jgi:hypothetical protein
MPQVLVRTAAGSLRPVFDPSHVEHCAGSARRQAAANPRSRRCSRQSCGRFLESSTSRVGTMALSACVCEGSPARATSSTSRPSCKSQDARKPRLASTARQGGCVCRVRISVQVASRVSQLPLRGAAVNNQGQNRPSKHQKVSLTPLLVGFINGIDPTRKRRCRHFASGLQTAPLLSWLRSQLNLISSRLTPILN